MNLSPNDEERRRLFRLIVRLRKRHELGRPIPSVWRKHIRLAFWWKLISFCFAEPWLMALSVLSLPAWVWFVVHKMVQF
jgi:hypothetical protein